jgi:hypothetical protein
LLSKNIRIKINRNIILPVVTCECETWFLKLKEECRLSVFENRVLRRVFGPKRDEVTGVIKSRKIRWARYVAHMGDKKGVCMVLVGDPEGKRPFGSPRSRWEGNTVLRWIFS